MTTLAERPPDTRERQGLNRTTKLILLALGAVLILTVAESITGSANLTTRGTASAALRLSIPILLAGLGGLYSERAGVVNIGLEGMMIAGTWFSAWGSWLYGPWRGVLLGLVGGAIFGLLHAIATVTFNVDHIVSGVAINILAAGSMRFLSSLVYTADTGGSVIQSPTVQGIDNIDIPFLAGGDLFGWSTPDFFGWLENLDWFFLSDVGGILRGFTGGVNWLTIIGLAVVPLTAWLLWRTAWGLQLRSCGEDPWAAESLGVPVLRMKYSAVVISGVLSGLAGAFLVLVQSGIYREGMTQGRGFIGLGALIFGNWIPSGVLSGSLVFGFGDALSFRGAEVFRAFVLALAIGLLLLAVYRVTQRRNRTAAITAGVGLAFLLFYIRVEELPTQLLNATPYLITLFVLAAVSQNLRMPAADGARYMKGQPR